MHENESLPNCQNWLIPSQQKDRLIPKHLSRDLRDHESVFDDCWKCKRMLSHTLEERCCFLSLFTLLSISLSCSLKIFFFNHQTPVYIRLLTLHLILFFYFNFFLFKLVLFSSYWINANWRIPFSIFLLSTFSYPHSAKIISWRAFL